MFLIPVVLSLLSGIPLLGNLFLVVALIIGAITNYKKAVAFGEGIGFTIGLCLLNPVFNMILAFRLLDIAYTVINAAIKAA